MTPEDPDRQSRAFGRAGVVALLTPAENPTAEPELSVLAGPDVNVLTARMHASSPDMLERLATYGDRMEDWVRPFGDAPIDAFAFACTGSSYLRAPGDGLPDTLVRPGGTRPLICAATALETALRQIGARRIALVNPYPSDLARAAVRYWGERGFNITSVHDVPPAPGGHPIYSRRADAILDLMRGLDDPEADAVMAMGTGAPSLPALAAASLETKRPMLSSNLCLAWAVTDALTGGESPFLDWLAPDAPWRARLPLRFPACLSLTNRDSNES